LGDQLIANLVGRKDDVAFHSIRQKLLLLAFIPTVHRTTSQVAASFPSLTREDIAQHVFSVLLEFLDSSELRARRSHLAFAVARKIRRSAFRWAIGESRHASEDLAAPDAPVQYDLRASNQHAQITLHRFLDACQRNGLLSKEERLLLMKFKLEGA